MAVSNLLFVCVDNSLLSLMAEAYVNAKSNGLVRAFSGGPMPASEMNSFGRKVLIDNGFSTEGLEPKSWNVFALPHAPQPDYIVELQSNGVMAEQPQWDKVPLVSRWQVLPSDARAQNLTEAKETFRRLRSSVDRALISGQFEKPEALLWRNAS